MANGYPLLFMVAFFALYFSFIRDLGRRQCDYCGGYPECEPTCPKRLD